jgi:type II secretory pathway pseudopilin PulG
MPTKRIAIFKYGPCRQRGAALFIMLVLLVVGIAAVLISSLTSSRVNTARQEKTAAALAQAKEALIGYAITYGDTHVLPPQVHGYLPCPDTSSGSEGVAASSCNSQGISAIGRLPWATLDLSALRDGDGECLWYVVSGTYKSGPKTSLMNWDTNGQFQVLASDGALLTQADNQVVAVIFAPGVPLSGQNQNRSPDGTAPICGGNYTATNYLENETVPVPGITVHGINNADVATGKFIQPHEHRDANNNVILTVNDQMIFITKQDIWNAIKKRNDFGAFVATLLSAATACLSSLPNPITIDFNAASLDSTSESAGTTVGNLITGRIPYSACTNNLVRQWRDNLLYAACTSGTCLTDGFNNYSGVVIFAGEKNSSLSQQRITNPDKNTWSNYLEDTPSTIFTAFTTGATTFTATSPYSASSPSTDVLAYIP